MYTPLRRKGTLLSVKGHEYVHSNSVLLSGSAWMEKVDAETTADSIVGRYASHRLFLLLSLIAIRLSSSECEISAESAVRNRRADPVSLDEHTAPVSSFRLARIA